MLELRRTAFLESLFLGKGRSRTNIYRVLESGFK
jgi:hypothetical protein